MKSFNKIFLILILLSSCKKNNDYILNSFKVAKDTLIIRTKKQKGENLFPLGAGPMEFKKQSDTFPYPIKYPNQIQDAQRFLLEPDFQEKEHYYVDIIKGIKNGQKVFSVDENNTITIVNNLDNLGSFTIQDKGSLIMINDTGIVTGDYTMYRNTPDYPIRPRA